MDRPKDIRSVVALIEDSASFMKELVLLDRIHAITSYQMATASY